MLAAAIVLAAAWALTLAVARWAVAAMAVTAAAQATIIRGEETAAWPIMSPIMSPIIRMCAAVGAPHAEAP